MENRNLPIQIIKTIRGERSASAFSKELGLSSNKIHRWESLHTILTWKDFIWICKKTGHYDEELFYEKTLFDKNIESCHDIITHFLTDDKRDLLFQEYGASKASFKKWYKDESSAPANIVFNIFHDSYHSLQAITKAFTKAHIPSEYYPVETDAETRYLAILDRCPWLHALQSFLLKNENISFDKLKDEIHMTFGFSLMEAQCLIVDLDFLGYLVTNESEQYRLSEVFLVDQKFHLGMRIDLLEALIQKWTKFSLYRLGETRCGKGKPDILTAIMELHIPDEAIAEYNDIFREAYKKFNDLGLKYEHIDKKKTKAYIYTSFLTKVENQKVAPFFRT